MCKVPHSDFEKLMFHFKHSHNLNSRSPVRCVDCGQMFTLRSRFAYELDSTNLGSFALLTTEQMGPQFI